MNENDLSFIFLNYSLSKPMYRWYYLAWMFFYCVLSQFISFVTMYVTSMLYETLSEGSKSKFTQYLLVSFICIAAQSTIQASKIYSRDRCALQWREIIVMAMHQRLFSMTKDTKYLFHTIFTATTTTAATPSPSMHLHSHLQVSSHLLTSIDQRITIDVDTFCTKILEILEKILIVPFVILFYVCWLGYYVGWYAPLGCVLYFLAGGYACHGISQKIVPLGYLQSQYEGNFRYYHIHFLSFLESIILSCGGSLEQSQMLVCFKQLLDNKALLLWRELMLNFGMNLFDYSGATVCYLIVGVAIFSHPEGTASSPDRIVLWSRGVYAGLTIISSFSAIIDSFQNYALTLAAKQRIEEFFSKIPSFDSKPNRIEADHHRTISEDESSESTVFLSSVHHHQRDIECTIVNPKSTQSTLSCAICQLEDSFIPLSTEHYLQLRAYDLYSKDQKKLLIKSLSLSVTWSMRLLITGATGSGKSSLLKVIANNLRDGLIPLLYCPQIPYFLHQRNMWDNLHYPHTFDELHAAPSSQPPHSSQLKEKLQAHYQKAKEVLDRCQLGQYFQYLSNNEGFNIEDLSTGEKQCFVVARALFHFPRACKAVVMFDEITSAVDEDTEARLYNSILSTCASFISVGHRSTIRKYHTHELILRKDGGYEWNVLS